MGKRYDHMTPAEQRAYDETDLRILQMLDEGETYRTVRETLKVSTVRITKVRKYHE